MFTSETAKFVLAGDELEKGLLIQHRFAKC
jgi:hypothetical protein